ncbi:MAG: hypothetical protein DRQ40_07740 [Gammaproteobacteria bacterium]|nr:MAG: hypothetical protein DRQ40_07740 [Gammaproteobacteria bacterium]
MRRCYSRRAATGIGYWGTEGWPAPWIVRSVRISDVRARIDHARGFVAFISRRIGSRTNGQPGLKSFARWIQVGRLPLGGVRRAIPEDPRGVVAARRVVLEATELLVTGDIEAGRDPGLGGTITASTHEGHGKDE